MMHVNQESPQKNGIREISGKNEKYRKSQRRITRLLWSSGLQDWEDLKLVQILKLLNEVTPGDLTGQRSSAAEHGPRQDC